MPTKSLTKQQALDKIKELEAYIKNNNPKGKILEPGKDILFEPGSNGLGLHIQDGKTEMYRDNGCLRIGYTDSGYAEDVVLNKVDSYDDIEEGQWFFVTDSDSPSQGELNNIENYYLRTNHSTDYRIDGDGDVCATGGEDGLRDHYYIVELKEDQD